MKRDDLQKRVAAYYQCLRDNGRFWRPTAPKNAMNNLWQCVPIPTSLRPESASRASVTPGKAMSQSRSALGHNMAETMRTATFNDRSQLQLRTHEVPTSMPNTAKSGFRNRRNTQAQ